MLPRATTTYIAGLLLLASLGCAPRPPQLAELPAAPPTFGFAARIHDARVLVCVITPAFTHADCAIVARAALAINTAVGRTLLLPPQDMTLDEAQRVLQTDEVTLITTKNLQEGELGVTAYQRPAGGTDTYIQAVVMLLSPEIWLDADEALSVCQHELLHACGAIHADQNTAFDSVERPGWYPGAPHTLTAGDTAALRAAYSYPPA